MTPDAGNSNQHKEIERVGAGMRVLASRGAPLAERPSDTYEMEAARRFYTLLEEQRDRFRFSTEAADIGYWFCNLPFDKLIWDECAKRHFWLPPTASVDIGLFYERIHPEDRASTREAIEQAIANRTRYDVEYRTVSDSGEVKWVRAIGRTAYDEAGTPIRFDGVTQDITSLKQAQQAFEVERQRLTAVFQNSPVGLVFCDLQGKILNGNRRAEQIFGHPILHSENVEQYADWSAFHPDGRPVKGHEYPLAKALADGARHRGEFLYRRGDGQWKWVEFVAGTVTDADGATVGGVVAAMDIDARKRAEEALMRSEKLALVGRLASAISHEINNPLEAVTNLLYLIEQSADTPEIRGYARSASEELARVSHIVTHTLRFARQVPAERREPVSVLLDSAVAIYEQRIRSAASRVVREYGGAAGQVCVPSEFRQVFANLVGNAFDAIRAGGAIRIRVRQSSSGSGKMLQVTVADTGCGMEKATLERLFDAFYSTKEESGTGLGLWITKDIVSRNGGSIRVRSKAGQGTTFRLELPCDLPCSEPKLPSGGATISI